MNNKVPPAGNRKSIMPKNKVKKLGSSDDYDSPWKEAIEIYFKDFMEFFFPGIANKIDWNRKHNFLDKEFQQIVRDAALDRRYADKLVSVWSILGDEIKVMIHIEIQADKDLNFQERMYVYNYRIYDKYRIPVTSLAILADKNMSWNPRRFSCNQWGCKINFIFPAVKLKKLGKDMDALLTNHNPFALITAAHLLTQTSKHNVQSRYDWKWKLTSMLYERNYTREQIFNLYRFIDWLMLLPKSLSKKFNNKHKKFEEEKKMPFITTAERIGREEGREEGQLIGRIQLVQQILNKCVSTDEDLLDKSIEELKPVYEALEKEWLTVK